MFQKLEKSLAGRALTIPTFKLLQDAREQSVNSICVDRRLLQIDVPAAERMGPTATINNSIP